MCGLSVAAGVGRANVTCSTMLYSRFEYLSFSSSPSRSPSSPPMDPVCQVRRCTPGRTLPSLCPRYFLSLVGLPGYPLRPLPLSPSPNFTITPTTTGYEKTMTSLLGAPWKGSCRASHCAKHHSRSGHTPIYIAFVPIQVFPELNFYALILGGEVSRALSLGPFDSASQQFKLDVPR